MVSDGGDCGGDGGDCGGDGGDCGGDGGGDGGDVAGTVSVPHSCMLDSYGMFYVNGFADHAKVRDYITLSAPSESVKVCLLFYNLCKSCLLAL
jgi:hypothetical protein